MLIRICAITLANCQAIYEEGIERESSRHSRYGTVALSFIDPYRIMDYI